MKYQRIMVIGNNGSGKSYLSKKLSQITGLPVIHLDLLYWKPDWREPTYEEWVEIQKKLVEEKKWIIDGNHTNTMEIRFQVADLIVFLDLNRFVCLKNVIKRLNEKRTDSPEFLEYRLDLNFLRFCKRLWKFSSTRKIHILKLMEIYQDREICVLKSKREIRQFLIMFKEGKDIGKFEYRF